MNETIIKIYEYISGLDSNSASQIYYGIDLLSSSFDDGLAFLNGEIQSKAQKGDYEGIEEITTICKQINEIKNMLNLLLDRMTEEEFEIFDEENDIVNANENVDYSQYRVSTDVCHSLDEDFTHKRPCGYLLNGKRYSSDTWQEILINVCSELAKSNRPLLESFVSSPNFKTKKINYFGKNYVQNKNKRIPGTDIYVWTNLSANDIRNLIKKVLVAFGIKPSTFSVFFRADYSQMHLDRYN